MTNEEAINILNDYDINFERHTAEEVAEAHEMAIKALQQQPSENEEIIKVSKGVLKARTGRFVIHDVEWLKENFNTTEAKIYGQPCEDCISRKAVLDGLASIAKAKAKSDSQKSLMGRVMFFTEHLPSVTPQPNECKYCHKDPDGYVKPLEKNCHAYIGFGMQGWVIELKAKGWRGKAPIKFCPMCGRRLTNG